MITCRAHVEFIMSAYTSWRYKREMNILFHSHESFAPFHSFDIYNTKYIAPKKHDVVLSCWCFVQIFTLKTSHVQNWMLWVAPFIFYMPSREIYILLTTSANSACVVFVWIFGCAWCSMFYLFLLEFIYQHNIQLKLVHTFLHLLDKYLKRITKEFTQQSLLVRMTKANANINILNEWRRMKHLENAIWFSVHIILWCSW